MIYIYDFIALLIIEIIIKIIMIFTIDKTNRIPKQ